jgi:hypothetical protein
MVLDLWVPTRTSLLSGRILALIPYLAGLDETSRISFNKVQVVAFDAVAEIASRYTEGLPRLLAKSDHQQISQDAAVKALLVVFVDSESQRLSQDAELRALRAQYDHLALRPDPVVGVINVDNLGTGNKIFKSPECVRSSSALEPWQDPCINRRPRRPG